MLPAPEGPKNYLLEISSKLFGAIVFIPFFVALMILLIPSRLRRKSRISQKKKPRILFGLCPIINLKSWSNAYKQRGYESSTVIWSLPTINEKTDYDKILISDPGSPFARYLYQIQSYLQALNFYWNFDVLQTAFKYSLLDLTLFWRLEGFFHYLFGTKTILHPYGSDAYVYRTITFPQLRHVLNASLKKHVLYEKQISSRMKYWERWADFLTVGVMFDGFSRWDAIPQSLLLYERDITPPKKHLSNGRTTPIRIAHSPNFRGFKGTEFILSTIDSLKKEGYKIDFTLIEGKKNYEVIEILRETDILVEQLICPGYGMNAVEGLSNDCVVISNLSRDKYLEVMKWFSFLDECPIVEGNPETLKSVLKDLIENPEKRVKIVEKNVEYVKTHHSPESFMDFQDMIIRKIWFKESLDLHFYFTNFKKFS